MTPPKKAAGAVVACEKQAAAAARFINATLGPRLQRAGLRARDCHAAGIELRPVWGAHLLALAPKVQERFGTATLPAFHQPFAASTCDGARVGVMQSGHYDFKVVAPGEQLSWPYRSFNATTLNVLRLLAEAARPADVVALKVDIEDHEKVLLPCLASNRRLGSLVDVLYIEEHTNGPALAPAYAQLRARGVAVETEWP